uniref:Secreted protein n=1 Tax=Panstrongylus lignarius TaxID=156445 RepID=A0A224XXC8_9HEMI
MFLQTLVLSLIFQVLILKNPHRIQNKVWHNACRLICNRNLQLNFHLQGNYKRYHLFWILAEMFPLLFVVAYLQ